MTDADELIAKTRGRIERVRRLAAGTTDQAVSVALTQMADDAQRDLDELERD